MSSVTKTEDAPDEKSLQTLLLLIVNECSLPSAVKFLLTALSNCRTSLHRDFHSCRQFAITRSGRGIWIELVTKEFKNYLFEELKKYVDNHGVSGLPIMDDSKFIKGADEYKNNKAIWLSFSKPIKDMSPKLIKSIERICKVVNKTNKYSKVETDLPHPVELSQIKDGQFFYTEDYWRIYPNHVYHLGSEQSIPFELRRCAAEPHLPYSENLVLDVGDTETLVAHVSHREQLCLMANEKMDYDEESTTLLQYYKELHEAEEIDKFINEQRKRAKRRLEDDTYTASKRYKDAMNEPQFLECMQESHRHKENASKLHSELSDESKQLTKTIQIVFK